MKHSISDLLDQYPAEAVALEQDAPLSSSRIKAMTMSRITQSVPRKRHTFIRPLVAAALAAALSISAMAAGNLFGVGDWFKGVFERSGPTLTTGQMDTINEIGKVIGTTIADNGASLTPLAILADENVCYVRLRVAAPEGTALPDLDPEAQGQYQLFGNSAGEYLSLSPAPGSYQNYGCSISCEWLPDEDPSDPIKEAVLIITVSNVSDDLVFNDGISKELTIHGLWIQSPDNVYTPVFKGNYSFDIGLDFESRVISLDCKGFIWQNTEYGYTNTLEKMELSPLSLSYRYATTLQENGWIFPTVGALRIVLKDGTVFFERSGDPALFIGGSFQPEGKSTDIQNADHPVWAREDYDFFDTPLDLSQVDYIQYGDHILRISHE